MKKRKKKNRKKKKKKIERLYCIPRKKAVSFISNRNCGKEFRLFCRLLGYFANDSGVVQTQSMWKYIFQAHLLRKSKQFCGFRLGKAGFIFWLKHSGTVTHPLGLPLASALSYREVRALFHTCHKEDRNLLPKAWQNRISKCFYRSSPFLVICLKNLLWLHIINKN